MNSQKESYICKQPEHEYTYFAEYKTWEDAEAHCVSLGQHLATIRSEEEQEKVNALCGNDVIWIGLNDKAVEGTFEWSSGVAFTYEKWHQAQPGDWEFYKGEPNNWNWSEDCVEIGRAKNKGFADTWNDAKCSLENHFVCSTH